MPTRQNQADFAKLCARYNIWAHKWQDARFCENCQKLMFHQRTPDQDTESQETIVDYLIFVRDAPFWVECKGKGDHNRLPFSEITEKQRNFMTSWVNRDVLAFLFVTLGTGRAPNNRKAWFIDWGDYFAMEERARSAGMVSLPWIDTGRKADFYDMTTLFPSWELGWDKGWVFPESHNLWKYVINLPPLYL